MITDSSARQQLDPRACRSSDQRAGRQQVAPALRNETTCELEPGGASGLNDVAGTDSDQVQSSENLNEASEVEMGPEVGRAMRKRAEGIILAGGSMVLIADEPRIAEVVSNELLLLVFFIVSGLEAPAADVLWAKRAFKEKMLAMLLASAIRYGEIDLAFAESEGKRQMVQAKAVQAAAKTKKKNLTRVKKEPDSSTGEEVNELQRYLREPYKAAFRAPPPRSLEAPPSPGSELVPPSASVVEPLPIPRPPPVSVHEDSEVEDEQEDARWAAFARAELETQRFVLEAKEADLDRRDKFLGLDFLSKRRLERETDVLALEIIAMESEMSNSGMKRLRDERDALGQELSREQALSARFAEVIERLRAERDDAREQLATAHADVDDLLEWKASTSLEAQRRLMCPRM